MPDYFLSDVHLRLDRPERGARLAAVVDRLLPDDALYIIGDLCDFWFAARQRSRDPLACPGLQALASYSGRGGRLVILGGNHDRWLGNFYQDILGATWIVDELRLRSHGLRVHLTHGHRFGARGLWKAIMESRAFLLAFRAMPKGVANRLESRLERSNNSHQESDDRRHLALYRRCVKSDESVADLVVLGHIHVALDESQAGLRLIVLGSWHDRASFLRIDDSGVIFVSEDDSARPYGVPSPGS